MREKVDPPFDQLQAHDPRSRPPGPRARQAGASSTDTVWGVDLSVHLSRNGRLHAQRAEGGRSEYCSRGSGGRGSCSTAARGIAAADGALDRAGAGRQIYLTHYHAGLPGAPRGAEDLMTCRRAKRPLGRAAGAPPPFSVLGRIFGKGSYDVELVELDEGEQPWPATSWRFAHFEVRTTGCGHSGTRSSRTAGQGGGIPTPPPVSASRRVQDFSRLQEGESVQGSGGVSPEQGDGMVGAPRAGRS